MLVLASFFFKSWTDSCAKHLSFCTCFAFFWVWITFVLSWFTLSARCFLIIYFCSLTSSWRFVTLHLWLKWFLIIDFFMGSKEQVLLKVWRAAFGVFEKDWYAVSCLWGEQIEYWLLFFNFKFILVNEGFLNFPVFFTDEF